MESQLENEHILCRDLIFDNDIKLCRNEATIEHLKRIIATVNESGIDSLWSIIIIQWIKNITQLFPWKRRGGKKIWFVHLLFGKSLKMVCLGSITRLSQFTMSTMSPSLMLRWLRKEDINSGAVSSKKQKNKGRKTQLMKTEDQPKQEDKIC